MASVQDRTKLKRVSYDTWSTREQLCLASSVMKAGDQNWILVSRSLKPFAEKEALRPPDWFSPKSCSRQYDILLENADLPKRKKRESGETAGESIVRRLTQERIAELGQILAFQRDEYQQLKAEVNLLRSGSITEEKLQKMWLAIEQEEREQEQKARAHSAWLAKRQQKQDVQSLQPLSLPSSRKSSLEAPADGQEIMEIVNDDEEKKNRGGRSPLLTSLLKSPSPTTQIQNPPSSAQVTSPTIASLLGSSPKVPNPQSTQNLQPQLHQMVTTAITNTPQERPSVGAPTLSMLLELPGNLQRGSLANLQVAVSSVTQQAAVPEIHVRSNNAKESCIINESSIVRQTTNINNSANIPVTESMVQIIDHIDDVIRKDIMADVIDKDEINEIIGDIDELINEEITSSPRKISENVTSPEIIKNIAIPETEKILVTERPEPRDVDEPVSLSNSPQSEMAIEEIDQSTSSIAEIIGTVAIEPVEQKITVSPVVEEIPEVNTKEEETQKESITEDKEPLKSETEVECKKEDLPAELSGNIEKALEEIIEDTEVKSEDVTISKIEEKIPDIESNDSPKSNNEKEANDTETATIKAEGEIENSKEHEETPDETKEKNDLELDQIEMDLAKITGDQNEPGSAEVVSVCSEVTTDIPSIEDNEKSQDISMILEDDQSSRSSSTKKKDTDEQLLDENAIDGSDSQESFKNETTAKDISKETIIEQPTELNTIEVEEILEKDEDNEKAPKIEESKDSEDSLSADLPEIDKKNEIDEEPIIEAEKSIESVKAEIEKKDPLETSKIDADDNPVKKCDSPLVKDEKSEFKDESEADSLIEQLEDLKKQENDVKEEEEEIKNLDNDFSLKKELVESTSSVGDDIGDLDDEESSLSKMSGGRAMKTYSKKQTIAVDREHDVENSGENADYKAWKKAVILMYNRLATHKYASLFLRPITEDHAPGYHDVIHHPIDLTTIKRNIDNGTIRTTMHFQRDVMLMFQNAIMYNKHNTFVYKTAVSMQEECLQHMQILVEVTGEGQLRRETRTAASSSSETSDTSVKRKRSHITPSPHDSESPRGKKRRKSEND